MSEFSLISHLESLDRDHDVPDEDVVASLLSVLGYASQSLHLRPQDARKTEMHMRSEYNRIKKKLKA